MLIAALCAGVSRAEDLAKDIEVAASTHSEHAFATSIGVSRQGTPIQALVARDALKYESSKTRVLLIGSTEGRSDSSQYALNWLSRFYSSEVSPQYREHFIVSAIPSIKPDGLAAAAETATSYPPTGNAYNSKTSSSEAAYAWRWIGMHAPDIVIELVSADESSWLIPASARASLNEVARELDPVAFFEPDDSLIGQLPTVAPCSTGTIPAMRVAVSPNDSHIAFDKTFEALDKANFAAISPARREMQSRLKRSASDVKVVLLKHCGKQLKQVVYIQSLAVLGRMRHIEQVAAEKNEEPDYAEIEAIASEYFSGKKTANLKSGSDLSGHLIFSELASRFQGEKRQRYIELARRAADIAFNQDGSMKPSMPFHNEMSDALFMGGPILAQVGALTGESKYFDACIQHLRFMRKLDWRDDGLYRHSPLDEAAWGRGNGFPAIGVAMCLDAIPQEHPGRQELLEAFQRHMAALAEHQDPNGCWHQVIDHPESYSEFTCTCMITYAMLRGISEGWLDAATYEPIAKKAWYAIRTRIGRDGELVDVCAGTGKQKSLRDYFDRTSILGRDDRGGAMALLVANEMEAYNQRAEPETKP